MNTCNCTTEIFVIADRSGSMSSIIDDAIGGFNSFLNEQKAVDGKANLSLVLFDNMYEVVHENIDLQSVPELNKSTYQPRGTTALYDAIGISLSTLNKRNPNKAIICIITDGQENSSKEYTKDNVVKLISDAEKKGWKVVYLAANQDAFAVGGSLGVSNAGCMSFAADGKDLTRAYGTVSRLAATYRSA